MSFISTAIGHKRFFLASILLVLLFGITTYLSMPKEAFPEINIPIMVIQVTDVGISPEDGERLIAKPLEKELKNVNGVKEIRIQCYESYCLAIVEFHAGFNADRGLRDAKDALDKARPYMPSLSIEPYVREINTSEFPVAIVNIYGSAPERALGRIADQLKDVLETLPGVLEADVGGKRTEQVEIVINPAKLNSYKLAISTITSFLGSTNLLIPAGSIETAHGSFPLKVPGLITNITDILHLPIKTSGDAVIKLLDIAEVRRNYEQATQEVRMNKGKSLSIEVKKRAGANTINTVRYVRAALEKAKDIIPPSVMLSISNDQSERIRDTLTDIENSVISSVILVAVCVMLMLGVRTGLLVGFSIPLSFFMGILVINSLGIGINMMVLFGLILAIGMLVDGAIVITEYADQKLSEGMPREKAYAEASSRMALVVMTSTGTTLMAFMPLIFWPGLIGEMLRYMPITVICVLLASLFAALVCVPILGALMGPKEAENKNGQEQILAATRGDYKSLKGYMRIYERILDWALRRPYKIFVATILILIMSFKAYNLWGAGMTFFPDQEPDFININVRARGNLSINEKAAFVQKVEDKIYDMPYFRNVYSRAGAKSRNAAEDVIGYVQVELSDWRSRPPAEKIIEEIGEKLHDVSGIVAEIVKQQKGPSQGKPIMLEISTLGDDQAKIDAGYRHVAMAMEAVGGFANIENNLPLPGIQWELDINKAQAAKFGISISSIGGVVQMLTRGTRISKLTLADLDEQIDLRVRFPEEYRSLDMIGNLYVVGANGANVPLSSFMEVRPTPMVNMIQRIDGRRVIRVSADPAIGQLTSAKVAELRRYMAENPPPQDVNIRFRGEAEDSGDAMKFVMKAFMIAIALMTLTMLAQFNSFFSTFIIMFSVVLSTIGVLLGLLITRDTFSIVMTGIAIVSLAGIIINNNIILIDAYNDLRKRVKDPIEALKRTGLLRIRPVYLTAITTGLGVLPMALKLNIDFMNAQITYGSPSMTVWSSFSRSLIFGLGFATILTLVVTPCMLMIGVRFKQRKG